MESLCLVDADPRERGRSHGEHWRAAIVELAALCVERAAPLTTRDPQARGALKVLSEHARDLFEEVHGIAEGADVAAEHVVLLNAVPGEQTLIYFNALDGPLLGQTWDLPDYAASWLRVLRLQPEGRDEACILLTLPGCLGMAGINAHGVAVGGAALHCTDVGAGIMGPAVVRRILSQTSARAGYDELSRTPLSTGHYYVIADEGDFFGVETTASHKVLTQLGVRAAHLHTNHCFDPVLRQIEQVGAGGTSFLRLNLASTIYAQQRPRTVDALWDLLLTHDPSAGTLCRHGDPKTGAVTVIRIDRGEVRAVRGCGLANTPITLQLESLRPRQPGP